MNRITPEKITELKPNEVYVFGSNRFGFHGASSAGYAFRGEAKNNWREDKFFLTAMKAKKGSMERIGKFAIFGQGHGSMQGREGKSYAIETIVKPGQKRSTSLSQIKDQIESFHFYVTEIFPELTYYVTELGVNYAGYSVEEIAPMFEKFLVLENVYLPKRFVDFLTK